MRRDCDHAPRGAPSTTGRRAAGERSLRRAAVVALLLASACGPSAEIVIALESAPGADMSSVEALRITVRDLEKDDPEIFGPFAIDREEPIRLGATVEPGHDFYVDVWGCLSTSVCSPTQLVGRGCTNVIQVPPGTTDAAVTIVMYDAATLPVGTCPPETE